MPTKQDYLDQIDSDMENETEPTADLKARRTAVDKAKDDETAALAYHEHVQKIADRSATPPPEDVPAPQ